MKRTFVAITIALLALTPMTAQQGGARYTPAPGAKDKKAANEAFAALTGSCVICHAYGNPLK